MGASQAVGNTARTPETLEPVPVASPRREVYKCNGVLLPETEGRHASLWTSGDVVAIDFGTTFCSMFYSLDGCPTCAVHLDGQEERIPTAILIDDTGKILAFGAKAGIQYENKHGQDISRHYYFHHIKMLLERKNNISRDSLVEADNGQEFYLVEVIAMMLKYMKDRLLKHDIRDRPDLPKVPDANNFTWVITVPAIWEAEGKQMMREAAYLAGIASTGLEISRLTCPTKDLSSKRNRPDETRVSSEKLILALEPEAAALYCLEDAKKVHDPSANASSYIVVDAGGGTLDITAHRLINDESDSHQIEVTMPPDGNDAGGNMINDEFMTYLQTIVEDPKFSKMFENKPADECSKNNTALKKIKDGFEQVKMCVGDKQLNDSTIVVELIHTRFLDVYKTILTNNLTTSESNDDLPSVTFETDTLIFSEERFNDFFKNTLDKAMKLIKDKLTIENVDAKDFEAVFCVGGFGGSIIFHNEVKKLIESINPAIRVYRPQNHSLAVVHGAIAFGKKPDIIKSRRAGATYGTASCTSFDASLHREEYKFLDDDNELQCRHIFSPFVFIGDKVRIDQCLFNYYTPVKHNQKVVTFCLYRTKDNVDIPYTHELVEPLMKQFKLSKNLQHVGELKLTLPKDEKKLDKKRKIKLTFDFAHTEIHVEAYDCDYDKKVSCTIDFLTMTG